MMSKNAKIPIRGVKGLFWKPDTYLDFVNFLVKNQFNYYMLCYTAFPESSSLWRQPYPKKAANSIQSLSQLCNCHGVELSVALNPGISGQPGFNNAWELYSMFADRKVSISSPDSPIQCKNVADRDLLWSKIRFLYDLEIRSFVFAFDDIAEDRWNSDFTAVAHNHANLLKFLNERLLHLDGENKLYYVPLTYANKHVREHPEYLRIISKDLPSNINIFWTGEEVLSIEFTKAQIATFSNIIERKPILWLNYPVNDSYLIGKLQMKPLNFHYRELWENITGLVINPMAQAEPSKIVIATISAYLQDPYEYTPKRALDKVLRDLYPENTISRLKEFIQLYSNSGFTKCTLKRIKHSELTDKEIANLIDTKHKMEAIVPQLVRDLQLFNTSFAKELMIAYKRLAFFINIYSDFMRYCDSPDESSRDKILAKIQGQNPIVALDARPIVEILAKNTISG